MSKERSAEVWDKILHILDEKLQYGFLEQAAAVLDVRLEGEELLLTVSTPEAVEFFNSELNEQRLILLVRSLLRLSRVKAKMAEGSPLR